MCRTTDYKAQSCSTTTSSFYKNSTFNCFHKNLRNLPPAQKSWICCSSYNFGFGITVICKRTLQMKWFRAKELHVMCGGCLSGVIWYAPFEGPALSHNTLFWHVQEPTLILLLPLNVVHALSAGYKGKYCAASLEVIFLIVFVLKSVWLFTWLPTLSSMTGEENGLV